MGTNVLKPINLLLTAWFAIGSVELLQANFEIAIHGNGSGGTPDNGTIGFPYTQTVAGATAGMLAQQGSGDGNGNHTAVTNAEVFAGDTFNSFASLFSFAENDRAGVLVPFGEASTIALWQDVVTLSGDAPLPSSIRLRFRVDGRATAELLAGNTFAQTFNSFSARGTSNPADFQGSLNASFYAENPVFEDQFDDDKPSYEIGRSFGNVAPQTQNWQTFSSDNEGAFVGEFALDVELDTALSSYDWAVLFSAYARTSGGSATTQLNSVSLIAMTDTLDEPLNDFDIEFDSGRTIELSAADGDFDQDTDVDGFDFLKWQRGESDDPLSAADLALWQSTYGNSSTLAATNIDTVPEPTAAILAFVGILLSTLNTRSHT